MSELKKLLTTPGITQKMLTTFLDNRTHLERVAGIRSLSGVDQARMYDVVAGAASLSLDFFVPNTVPDMTEVIHHGKNSLPFFTKFQKRFCRPHESSAVLYGYNEQAFRPVTGPGYFVVKPLHADRRIVIDYRTVPLEHVEGWPPLSPNSRLLSRFVYHNMQDFMWRVSEHVSVGRAFKAGRWLPNYFVLCREDRE